MAFKKLKYTKTWLSPADFPTEEDSEAQVRQDLQQLHDEARDGLNGLVTELEADTAAESLGAKDENGKATTVQQLLGWMAGLFSGVTRLDRTLSGDPAHSGVPTSAAVREALDGVVTGDLSATGADFILRHVWLATQYTPAEKRVCKGEAKSEMLAFRTSEELAAGAELKTEVFRAAVLTVDGAGKPVPAEPERILVESYSDALAGYYWTRGESWTAGAIFFTPAGVKTERCAVNSDESGLESGENLVVTAHPVTVEPFPEETGSVKVIYDPPESHPMSGFAEDPLAAPFKGYRYRGLGPFKNLPLYQGSGGNVTVLATDTVLYTPQILTDVQKRQARENIGAAAAGEGGSYALTEDDVDLIVAATLAALPNADKEEF